MNYTQPSSKEGFQIFVEKMEGMVEELGEAKIILNEVNIHFK